jgi:hypothetical protein
MRIYQFFRPRPPQKNGGYEPYTISAVALLPGVFYLLLFNLFLPKPLLTMTVHTERRYIRQVQQLKHAHARYEDERARARARTALLLQARQLHHVAAEDQERAARLLLIPFHSGEHNALLHRQKKYLPMNF